MTNESFIISLLNTYELKDKSRLISLHYLTCITTNLHETWYTEKRYVYFLNCIKQQGLNDMGLTNSHSLEN